MRSKIAALIGCIIMMTLLTGCFGGGSGSGSSSSGGGFSVADLGGSSDSGGGISGGGGDLGGGILGGGGGALPNNPEPATIALVGSGVAAYFLLKRKKK